MWGHTYLPLKHSSIQFLSVCLNFLLLQKESGEEVEVEEFYVKYKNL